MSAAPAAKRDTVNITGVVVYARPAESEQVRAGLVAIAGVEVHAVGPDGRMVVTVERDSDDEATEVLNRLGRLPGVLSAALVYHHHEDVA